MSFTNAFNKKDFLSWVAGQIEENEVVVVTAHHSELAAKSRPPVKDVTFNFPAFGFVNKVGVKDLFESKKVGVVVMDRKHLDKGVLDVVDGVAKEYKDPNPAPKPKKARRES